MKSNKTIAAVNVQTKYRPYWNAKLGKKYKDIRCSMRFLARAASSGDLTEVLMPLNRYIDNFNNFWMFTAAMV